MGIEPPPPCRKLGDVDSNHDKQYQKLLCYRYTIAQSRAVIVSLAG